MCGRTLALLALATVAAAAEIRPEAAAVAAPGGERRAAARWFLGGHTVTRVLLEHEIVTQRTSSSCVVVAPSLPPCRSMRALHDHPDVRPAQPAQVLATTPAELPVDGDGDGGGAPEARTLGRTWTRSGNAPILVSSEPTPTLPTEQQRPAAESGWNWNLFGPDITVTTVLRQVETLKKLDPNLMVTFSVTGCQPTRLPFDLEHCDNVPRVEVVKAANP
ncbi:hypothetical protein R5R35_011367 [Gryllus longicercus]|uniref:Accessory gland protein n=1 Tax=Gryllus longicercus TaxID=2509291 RepID=A0AAN9WNR4_9ORTH